MEGSLDEIPVSLSNLGLQKDKMIQLYSNESRKMEKNMHNHVANIFSEFERMAKNLEDQKNEFRQWREKEVKKQEAQCTLDVSLERMREALQVMENIGGKGDKELKKKLYATEQQLKLKEEELKSKEEDIENLKDCNQVLTVNNCKLNTENMEAREELIKGLREIRSGLSFIGLKRMGELDKKPFYAASKGMKKHPGKGKGAHRRASELCSRAHRKASELCSMWEQRLRDPSWRPFKIISEETSSKEVIDEEDKLLKDLKVALGDDVFKAVTTALMEINEFNPSGRYPVFQLWNFKEGREATLGESVASVFEQHMNSSVL